MSYYDNSKELDQIADLQATIADLQGQLEVAQNKQTALEKSVRNLTEFYDKYNGTPCEQIRHQQEVELLQQRVAQLEGERDVLKRDQFATHACAKTFEQMSDESSLRRLLASLQADHARVLAGFQALLNVIDDSHDEDLPPEILEARDTAYELKASLPAQPAQGAK